MQIYKNNLFRVFAVAMAAALALAGCGAGSSSSGPGTGGGTCQAFFAPGVPYVNNVIPGNGSMQVQFNQPGFATSYKITATPAAGSAVTLSIPDTGALSYSPTMTGLTNGTAYTVTILAINCLGSTPSANSLTGTPATVPGAPILGTLTPGNTQVTVNFTAPASNGGSAITYYTVTANPGNIQAVSYTSGPVTITGLVNGTSYSFAVTATNVMGTGASSASGSATPSTLPSAPTGVAAVAGNAQATVSFTIPASNGGSAITSYTVTPSPSGTPVTGTASPITVPNLTNGTAYTFTVTATNVDGAGPSSAASNSVIPLSNPGPYYVDPVAGLDTQPGTQTAPFKTITYALNVAAGFGTANTINAAAGTYNTASGETFPLQMINNVNLTGSAGAATTTISGSGNTVYSVFTFGTTLVFPPGVTSTVTGFTLTGAAGVIAVMNQAASATLANDILTPGTAVVDGLYIIGTTSATLTGNTISGNCAGYGAVGLWSLGSTLKARGNTLSDPCNPAVSVWSDGTANSTVDLGTAASPGGNTIHGGTSPITATTTPVGLVIFGNTIMVNASGNTWYKNKQGSNSFGQYTVGATGTNPSAVVAGNNYSIQSSNTGTPSAGLQF